MQLPTVILITVSSRTSDLSLHRGFKVVFHTHVYDMLVLRITYIHRLVPQLLERKIDDAAAEAMMILSVDNIVPPWADMR